LASLFGADSRVGSRGIDKSNQWQAESCSHVHQAQSLAVTLGTRHSEIPEYFGFGVAAFLLADKHQRTATKQRQTTHNGVIVRKGTIAVQFVKLIKDLFYVIECVWPLRVAAELGNLPRREILEYALDLLAHLGLQTLDFLVQIDGIV
jgi:hypothetical protein